MGFVREPHGRIAIETRRESFYIHADYDGTPLEHLWSNFPHPEIAYEDLEDLLEALQSMARDR